MPNVILRPDWHLPESAVTSEAAFMDRRGFMRRLGVGMGMGMGMGLAGAVWGGGRGWAAEAGAGVEAVYAKGYPHPRNKAFDPGWALTDEKVASTYNNFYEFTLRKDVHRHVGRFRTAPWPVEIGGLVEKPMTVDAGELVSTMPMEERVYRFRCVEAWAMVVPWTGFVFSKLVERVKPRAEARFVRFVTASKPEQMPGIADNPEYPWPYFEGLRMDEALNPLTFIATGVYGKPLAKQFGAPMRLVVPWKYGYKSPKSVVRIEFVAEQPKTFWETLQPREYPFESNVDPGVPHPRWSQATERMIDTGDRVRTKKYNGYGEQVAHLYAA
jgi:sulfoxide reductase catalytic subunit YedY